MGKGQNAAPYSDQSNWSNTYLTDPKLIAALGPFQTDPACPPKMPWRTAENMLCHELVRRRAGDGPVGPKMRHADGLKEPWKGRVWMNPPYRGTLAWAKRLAAHGEGCALLNGRSTETRATHALLAACAGLYLFDCRLTWYRVNGKAYEQKWFPSLLIGMGPRDLAAMRRLPRRGFPGQLFIPSRIN